MYLRFVLVLAATAVLLPAQDHWVATWTTAQLLAHLTAGAGGRGRSGAAPQSNDPVQAISLHGFQNQTVRMIAHSSIARQRVRLRLENAFAGAP